MDVGNFTVVFWISIEGTEENNENSPSLASAQVEIRKENLSNTSQERYKFSQSVLSDMLTDSSFSPPCG